MLLLLIIGFIMMTSNLFICYLELLPFLNAVETEKNKARHTLGLFFLPFRLLIHLPKLLPFLIDISVMIFASSVLGFGGGLIGGITGLFGSNVLSLIIYMHRHKNETVPVKC